MWGRLSSLPCAGKKACATIHEVGYNIWCRGMGKPYYFFNSSYRPLSKASVSQMPLRALVVTHGSQPG